MRTCGHEGFGVGVSAHAGERPAVGHCGPSPVVRHATGQARDKRTAFSWRSRESIRFATRGADAQHECSISSRSRLAAGPAQAALPRHAGRWARQGRVLGRRGTELYRAQNDQADQEHQAQCASGHVLLLVASSAAACGTRVSIRGAAWRAGARAVGPLHALARVRHAASRPRGVTPSPLVLTDGWALRHPPPATARRRHDCVTARGVASPCTWGTRSRWPVCSPVTARQHCSAAARRGSWWRRRAGLAGSQRKRWRCGEHVARARSWEEFR